MIDCGTAGMANASIYHGRSTGGDQNSGQPAALELAANDYITCRVNPVDLKNGLCDLETDCRDCLHVWLLQIAGGLTNTHMHGPSVPVGEPPTASTAPYTFPFHTAV
jgi:hypothetical protein